MYSHVCRHRDASSLELSLRYSASSFKSDSSMEEECDSSSMDGNQGLEPYQYEPSASAESEVNSPDLESSKEDDTERLTSTSWCKCGNCVVMPTVTECVCCSEIDRVVDKMEENTSEIHCIIDHEGFDAVCLNLWVLQTAFHQFRHSHGSQIPAEDDETHRKYRFTAYAQLTWWCWGWLGKKVRVCLPSCAVKKIRDAFPSNQYTGFKYPKLKTK